MFYDGAVQQSAPFKDLEPEGSSVQISGPTVSIFFPSTAQAAQIWLQL